MNKRNMSGYLRFNILLDNITKWTSGNTQPFSLITYNLLSEMDVHILLIRMGSEFDKV